MKKLINYEKEELLAPITEDRDLGIMLYDMDFKNIKGYCDWKTADATFYRARMEKGVIIVPPRDSEEVLR